MLINKNRNQAHALTIKRVKNGPPCNAKWMLVDSENSCPIALASSKHWHIMMLTGSITN